MKHLNTFEKYVVGDISFFEKIIEYYRQRIAEIDQIAKQCNLIQLTQRLETNNSWELILVYEPIDGSRNIRRQDWNNFYKQVDAILPIDLYLEDKHRRILVQCSINYFNISDIERSKKLIKTQSMTGVFENESEVLVLEEREYPRVSIYLTDF